MMSQDHKSQAVISVKLKISLEIVKYSIDVKSTDFYKRQSFRSKQRNKIFRLSKFSSLFRIFPDLFFSVLDFEISVPDCEICTVWSARGALARFLSDQ